jgi:nucleotide-binding universal stress UspA family protein
MNSIVVGTDGSEGAERALERAADIAKACGATVHVVVAVPQAYATETYESSARAEHFGLGDVAESVIARAERKLQDAGVAATTTSRGGDAARVILDVADELDADLIVVGARGLTGLQKFLLGSVSSKVSHYADRTVMVVRD